MTSIGAAEVESSRFEGSRVNRNLNHEVQHRNFIQAVIDQPYTPNAIFWPQFFYECNLGFITPALNESIISSLTPLGSKLQQFEVAKRRRICFMDLRRKFHLFGSARQYITANDNTYCTEGT